jgi:hypothetical protein
MEPFSTEKLVTELLRFYNQMYDAAGLTRSKCSPVVFVRHINSC